MPRLTIDSLEDPNANPRSTRPFLRGHTMRVAVVLLVAPLLGGCMAYSRRSIDTDRTPSYDMGTRASIILPSQTAPALPGTTTQRVWNPPGGGGPSTSQSGTQSGVGPSSGGGAPQAGAAPQAGYPQNPSGGPAPEYVAPQAPPDPNAGMSYIGGSQIDEKRSAKVEEDPLILKYLMAPVAVAAAPFVAAKEAIQGEPEPGPAIPERRQAPLTPVAPRATEPGATQQDRVRAQSDYEAAMQQNLERELAAREAQSSSAPSIVSTAPVGAGGPSIADELAALERTPDAPRADTAPAPIPAPQRARASERAPTDSTRAIADGIVDRNDDGLTDQWIYREGGEISRQVYDEDYDGRPDRTVYFDLDTHQISRVEEDTTADGVVDSWTEYRDGSVVRRRGDANGDGRVDTWSFYRGGELTRHEQDTTHDGYRDSVSYYEVGRLTHEERDADGDGSPEVTLFYDASEKLVRREHDEDGDGRVDVVSHYEGGRLTRRELLHTAELDDTNGRQRQ